MTLDLAVRARTALANAREVTLLVDGLGATADDLADVVLHDRDGRPTFLCGPGSPVAAAARAARAGQVCVEARNARGERWSVCLHGRLAPDGTEEVGDSVVHVVGLVVHTVELHDAGRRSHVVPLGAYLRAQPDALACCAQRILAHTNRAHPGQLRATVARHAGTDASRVAAAELGDLDRHGVTLHWVDERGAHRTRLHFAEPAGGAHDLAETLRIALRAGEDAGQDLGAP